MKKILLILFSLIIFSSVSYANCPSTAEYSANLRKATSATAIKNYLDSVTSGCIAYFKSTRNPDCDKFTTLFSAYMTMYNRNSAKYKSEIQGLEKDLSTFCPANYESVKDILFK